MGGRVAQRTQRVEGLDGLLRLLSGIDALRLIDDDEGAGGLYELDGLAAGESVALPVDDIALAFFFGAGEVLAEGIDVDHQDLQSSAGGEAA